MKFKKTVIIDFILLGLISAFYIALYWQKWCDPISDFGRELYVAWRISQGQILYKDIASLFGAFPTCWNAFLFIIFGPSIMTLTTFDTFVTLFIAALIYRFFYKTCGRLTAVMTSTAYLVLFAFNFADISRCMYYLAPYSHSNLYALFFAFCSLNLFQIYSFQQKFSALFLLGTCLGFMVLSRLEIFLLFSVSLAVGLILYYLKSKMPLKAVFTGLALAFIGFIQPIASFLLYFNQKIPTGGVFLKIIGYNSKWREIQSLHLYQSLGGYDNWSVNLKKILLCLGWYILFLLGLHIFYKGIKKLKENGKSAEGWILVMTFAALLAQTAFLLSNEYLGVSRCEIFFLPVYIFLYFRKIIKSRNDRGLPGNISLLILGVWSLLMAFKLPFNPNLTEYGLIYYLPGSLACLVLLVADYPEYAQERYHSGWIAKVILIACFFLVFIYTFQASVTHAGWKIVTINEGPNRLKIFDDRNMNVSGNDIARLIIWTKKNVPPDATFILLPNGAMMNFLAKRPNPTPYDTFMPAEVLTFDKDKILESVSQHPPDYFIINHRQKLASGDLVIGMTFNNFIYTWIKTDYTRIWESGINRKPGNFGIEIFQKNDRSK